MQKNQKISKHSKQWWTEDCRCSLDIYRLSRSLENWKKFKKIVKDTKKSLFNNKIQEIANKSRGPWELMNWIKRRKLPAIEAITHDGQPCLTLDSLWNTLHNTLIPLSIVKLTLTSLTKLRTNLLKAGFCSPKQIQIGYQQM